jgi:undecaprenyl-diphosphatase
LQGITEVLPISSSGHHQIVSTMLNINDNSITLSVMLHFASFFAVIIYLRNELKDLIVGFLLYFKDKNKYNNQFKMVVHLCLSTIVLVIVTVCLKLCGYNSSPIWVVGICLIINGIMLKVFGNLNGTRPLDTFRVKDAIVVGLFQSVGALPGISRSGSCLCGCKVLNINKDDSKKYAFLLFIPAILGSLVLELKNISSMVISNSFHLYSISFITSLVTTYFAFEFLSKIIKKGKLTNFSIYCMILGVVVILYSIVS